MIKEIDYNQWHTEFLQTEVGKQVKADFPSTICKANYQSNIAKAYYRWGLTPRELMSSTTLPTSVMPGDYSVVPYYYINILQSYNPKTIVDLGSGSGPFKKYYPNIIGIDPIAPQADICEAYNEEFIRNHYEEFESLICINMSWAWRPDETNVTYGNLQDSLQKFSQIIKPGGHCALCVPAWGLNIRTPKSWFEENGCNYFEEVKLKQYVKDQILTTPGITVTHLDVEVGVETFGGSVDGDIRVVFEKNYK